MDKHSQEPRNAYPFRGSSTYDRALATTESEEMRASMDRLAGWYATYMSVEGQNQAGKTNERVCTARVWYHWELECGVGERLGECSRRIFCSIRTAVLLYTPRYLPRCLLSLSPLHPPLVGLVGSGGNPKTRDMAPVKKGKHVNLEKKKGNQSKTRECKLGENAGAVRLKQSLLKPNPRQLTHALGRRVVGRKYMLRLRRGRSMKRRSRSTGEVQWDVIVVPLPFLLPPELDEFVEQS